MMQLLRCYVCSKLTLDKFVNQGKFCKCGSRKFREASPSNLIEWIIVLWWEFTVEE